MAAGFLAGAALAFPAASARATSFAVWTNAAPAFALPAFDRPLVRLTDGAARLTLVHFFATWCEPCREELPALQRFAARGGEATRILAVSVAEPDTRVQRFFGQAPVAFPVLFDRDRAVAKAWGVTTLPTTIALDGRMRARLAQEGPAEWDALDPQAIIRAVESAPTE